MPSREMREKINAGKRFKAFERQAQKGYTKKEIEARILQRIRAAREGQASLWSNPPTVSPPTI